MKRFLLLVALFLPTFLLAQSGLNRSIQGQVRLPGGKAAGSGMYVTLESDASGGFLNTQTDSNGKFSFNALAAVRYRVRVSAPGYQTESQDVDMSMSPFALLQFNLKEKPGQVPGAPPITGVATVGPNLPADMPQDAREEFQKGFDIFKSGKNQQKSISHFKKSAEKYDSYAPTHYYLGAAYAIGNDFDKAVPELQKSLELNDSSPEALIALGSIYNKQKNYAEAEKVLTKAVALAPDSFDAHEELAKSILPVLPRTPEAEQQLTKAVALNPNSVESHILLGNVYLRKRDKDAALKQYKEAVQLDPNGPMAGPTKQMIEKLEK